MKPMVEKKIKSALPYYSAAAAFLVGAVLLPIYQLWAILVSAGLAAVAYGVADKKIPPRIVMVAAPDTAFATGEAALDATLATAEKDLKQLAMLHERIPDVQLTADIARMEKAGRQILTEVQKSPKEAKKIRKFATYYLPTSIKVLTAYADLCASGAQGQNAQSLMMQIKQNAATIATAFEAQLDSLFADEVLDVSADIAVLDQMIKGDGLSPQDLVQQAASSKPT